MRKAGWICLAAAAGALVGGYAALFINRATIMNLWIEFLASIVVLAFVPLVITGVVLLVVDRRRARVNSQPTEAARPPSPVDRRLEELETLRASRKVSETEYAEQRARILSDL